MRRFTLEHSARLLRIAIDEYGHPGCINSLQYIEKAISANNPFSLVRRAAIKLPEYDESTGGGACVKIVGQVLDEFLRC